MTRARKELMSLDTTPYYHYICRCKRRAFLCGEDHLTGKNYEHHKPLGARAVKNAGEGLLH